MKAHARNTDPFTSHEAAASVVGLRPKQLAVLDCLKLYGPAVDLQLLDLYRAHAEAHGWPEQSDSGLRTRRCELAEKNLIRCVGTSILPSGRKALVWGIRQRQADPPVPGVAAESAPTLPPDSPPTLFPDEKPPDKFDPWRLDLA